MIEFEKFLAPWEHDKDGKPLDEPADLDAAKLKKFLYNLLSDKEKLQDTVKDVETERDQVKESLAEVQREHENEDQRRAREEKEREKDNEKLRKAAQANEKIEALEAEYPDATAAQLRKLANRVHGDSKAEWVADAKELVSEGFKITPKATKQREEEDVDLLDDDDDEELIVTPRVRRSDGSVPKGVGKPKFKSVADELDAAGIGQPTW